MKFKKLGTLVLVLLCTVSFLSINVSADNIVGGGQHDGYKSIAGGGSSSYTSFSEYTSFPNLINQARFKGTSRTKWMGSTPYNADSIQHKNIASCTCLGGLSLSTSGGGGSVSGSTMTDSMTVNNTWQINSTFDYTVQATLFIFSTSFGTSGRVQIGSNFYSISATS